MKTIFKILTNAVKAAGELLWMILCGYGAVFAIILIALGPAFFAAWHFDTNDIAAIKLTGILYGGELALFAIGSAIHDRFKEAASG